MKHQTYNQLPDNKKTKIKTSDDIHKHLTDVFNNLKDKKIGLFLSGGMDSAILTSYMPYKDAYTFRFLNGEFAKEELKRAEEFANYYHLNLHYVDIDWNKIKNVTRLLMEHKGAPIHSIEPQLYLGALEAKKDGMDLMIIGDASDYVFGGMDKLLSKDWLFDEFYNRYIYINPEAVLKEPVDMKEEIEPYRIGNNIDFERVIQTITIDESYASYKNAFDTVGSVYIDPYDLYDFVIISFRKDLKEMRFMLKSIDNAYKCYNNVRFKQKLIYINQGLKYHYLL